ncbi:hypothetical protein PR048_008096 [Dryococelus australis]|uniref:Transposase n=1 Tax=Dryococelus australis TaxID=614101 RepID=A0ABQ9HW40_9NEOP|nr:hypothetical protein PR048_008096 [Dryococelus australis]
MSKPKNSQKFCKEYSQLWTSICASRVPENDACWLCSCNFSVQHGGRKRTVNGTLVMQVVTRPITSHFQSDTTDPTTKAEVLFIMFLVEHNLPLAVYDQMGPLLKAMCLDSIIIQKYSCKRTKTTVIVQALAESSQEEIVTNISGTAFSIATDGSHHAVYRSDLGKIVSEVLAVPVCKMSNTGENIFKLLNEELQKKRPLYKGTAAFISEVNPNIYIQRCARHLIHIAAQNAAKVLTVSIKDLLIDLYYYLDKNTLRHQTLEVSDCVDILLEQWPVLENFFHHEITLSCKHSKSGPSVNLAIAVSSDITGSNSRPNTITTELSFGMPSQNCTVCFSKILYQYLLRMKIHVFMFFTVNSVRFLKTEAIRNVDSVLTVEYCDRKIQKENCGLVIGVRTRSYINDNSVGLTEVDVCDFYSCVRKYFESACKYIVDKFPL